jgi:hypothetical protein
MLRESRYLSDGIVRYRCSEVGVCGGREMTRQQPRDLIRGNGITRYMSHMLWIRETAGQGQGGGGGERRGVCTHLLRVDNCIDAAGDGHGEGETQGVGTVDELGRVVGEVETSEEDDWEGRGWGGEHLCVGDWRSSVRVAVASMAAGKRPLHLQAATCCAARERWWASADDRADATWCHSCQSRQGTLRE